jgi:ABC-2 type transport system permease protein
VARSRGLGTRRVDEVLALAGLQAVARRKAGGYSLGMRQRLGIAAAGHGIGPSHGYPAISPGDGAVLRAAFESVLYLALIALLSLGAATALREAGVAIGAVLRLLYLVPIIAFAAGDADLSRHLQQIAPMTAGAGHPGHHRPERPAHQPLGRPGQAWAGLGVLAAWAAGALLLAGLLLHLRDA